MGWGGARFPQSTAVMWSWAGGSMPGLEAAAGRLPGWLRSSDRFESCSSFSFCSFVRRPGSGPGGGGHTASSLIMGRNSLSVGGQLWRGGGARERGWLFLPECQLLIALKNPQFLDSTCGRLDPVVDCASGRGVQNISAPSLRYGGTLNEPRFRIFSFILFRFSSFFLFCAAPVHTAPLLSRRRLRP